MCFSIYPSIRLSTHPSVQKLSAKSVALLWPHIPLDGTQAKDLRVMKVSWQHKQIQFNPAHSLKLVLLPEVCVSWWGAPSLPCHVLLPMSGFKISYFTVIPYSSSQRFHLQHLKGHRMAKSELMWVLVSYKGGIAKCSARILLVFSDVPLQYPHMHVTPPLTFESVSQPVNKFTNNYVWSSGLVAGDTAESHVAPGSCAQGISVLITNNRFFVFGRPYYLRSIFYLRKMELLHTLCRNAIKIKIWVCFLPWMTLEDGPDPSHRFFCHK